MIASFQSNVKLSGYISLDRILEQLQDLHWHSLDEIKLVISMPLDKLNDALRFLQEQTLIDKKEGRLKITCTGLKFLQLKS